MHALPFGQPGRFYRGNLHTHSTASDGALAPAQVVASYQQAGYDFVALTDHFLERYGFPVTETRPRRDAAFTTLLGAELHAGKTGLGDVWHILAVGLPKDFGPTAPDEPIAALCARAVATGAFVAAAHPAWYGVTAEDVLSLGAIQAIEVYNATCTALNARGESWHVLDALLAQGRRYLAVATDDAHFQPQRPDWQRAWVQVKAPRLEPQAMLDALHAGHFYSSTGPQLHNIVVERGDRISISCSPCQAIFVAGRGSWAQQQHGEGLTEVTLSLVGAPGPCVRVTVRDAAGHHAWSNPIWL